MFFGKKRIAGQVTLVLKNVKTGKERLVQRNNLVVDNGEKWAARRMLGTLSGGSQTAMQWMELGKGSLAATGTQTNLQTTVNIVCVRKKATTQSVTNATWTIIVNWNTSHANTSGIKEAGIFGCSARALTTVPGMFARTTFSAVNKTNADTLKITWAIGFVDDGV